MKDERKRSSTLQKEADVDPDSQQIGTITRRTFVGAAPAAIAAPMIVPRHVLGGPGADAA